LERKADRDPAGDDSTRSTTFERASTMEGEADTRRPDAAPLEPTDLVGRTLLHFRVVERLGEGGMGVVYKATDEKLKRPIALKVLGERYLFDDRNKQLLLREARSAAAVSHPNIASIHDVHDTGDIAFIAMEFIDGQSLRALLEKGPLPPREALGHALAIAAGLARAHAAKIVHRDLKADNVMLTRDGHVKILDFGLAKPVQGELPEPILPEGDAPSGGAERSTSFVHSTAPGRIVGTPAYMSPEQARGEIVDARTDVFAFGVMLYEMLTGKVPFAKRGDRPWEWTEEDWRPQEPLRALVRGLDRRVEALVAKCLELAPEKRYAGGADLVAAIEPLAATSGAHRRGRGFERAIVVVAVLALAVLGLMRIVRPPEPTTVARVSGPAAASSPSVVDTASSPSTTNAATASAVEDASPTPSAAAPPRVGPRGAVPVAHAASARASAVAAPSTATTGVPMPASSERFNPLAP
jgi:serine/threonine-protein kinase